ncbi:helix-turn-helix domain-containing protein [Brevibacillus laterosporus]|uniref:helix-turn-helix domain-containing protein n=1 Tax=Brevibacillus laterosporus TaxID=1465 RepID=UPI000E6C3531|nr:helix-turn-helix domain-containing protein [Brevibacillus laterosporus]AYB38181.1 helix-turn-helix domain-containing protein [Brevibacillus laterosporus]
MSHKAKISGSEKIAAIEKYLRGEDSLNHLANLLDVSFPSIKQWLQTYQTLGPNGLLNTSKNSSYSTELKKTASRIIWLVVVLTWIYVKDMASNQPANCVTGS